MATCTPIYGLPVVEGSDRPCDVDDWSCNFATAVETQLEALDEVINRTFVTTPMAWVRSTTSVTQIVGIGGALQPNFDTVVVDTDNMVDLNANAARILTQHGGMFYLWYSARGTRLLPGGSSAAPIIQFTVSPLTVLPTLTTLWVPQDERGGSVAGDFAISGGGYMIIPAGTSLLLSLQVGGLNGNSLTYNDVHMGAFWVGDAS